MPCKREARQRHNTIAFWLSDEERQLVEARIKVAGIPKGEYYRAAVLGQSVEIVAGRYKSERLAKVLEELSHKLKGSDSAEWKELQVILQELLSLLKK